MKMLWERLRWIRKNREVFPFTIPEERNKWCDFVNRKMEGCCKGVIRQNQQNPAINCIKKEGEGKRNRERKGEEKE